MIGYCQTHGFFPPEILGDMRALTIYFVLIYGGKGSSILLSFKT